MSQQRLTSLRGAVAAVVTIGLASAVLPPAAASPAPAFGLAERMAATVEGATGTADVIPAAHATHDAENTHIVSTSGGSVRVPRSATRPIVVTTRTGETITVSLPPIGTRPEARTSPAGTTVYADARSGSATAVQATADGVRELFTIQNAAAPHAFTIELRLPTGAIMTPDGDGEFDIVTRRNDSGPTTTLVHIAAPWAKDATGKLLPSSYTLDGTSLTQQVNTAGATYPVIADPQITWGWVTGTIYFNKAETKMAAASGAYAAFWASFVPGWGTALRAYAATLTFAARLALATNQCLKIKLPVPMPGSYSGGYCR